MSDFISFNEFVDRTASAKFEHYRETMGEALKRRSGANVGFLAAAVTEVADEAIEAEFAKSQGLNSRLYRRRGG